MKRIALALACAFLLTAMAGTGNASGMDIGVSVNMPTGGSGKGNSGTSYASFSVGQLAYELVVRERGGRLSMELRVTNDGDTSYSITHSDGQQYDFVVMDKRGHEIYRWSEGREFDKRMSATQIKAGGYVLLKNELSGTEYKNIKGEAVVVTAYVKDTPYTVTAAMPERVSGSGNNAIHGAVRISSGHGRIRVRG